MEIYYAVIIVAFLLCFFDFVHIQGIKKALYYAFCTFLVLFAGQRAVGVDNDSLSYQAAFNFYANSSVPAIIKGGFGYAEKGYVFLNYYVAALGFTYHDLLILIAFLIGFFNFSYFSKYSKYLFLSLLFYVSFFYFYRDFTQIRYALSGALVFWFVTFYQEKKFYKALLFFIIAVLFHNAAFIMIPVLLMIRYVDNKYVYILLPIPCLLLGVVFNSLALLLSFNFDSEHLSIYNNDQSGGSLSISIIGYILISLYLLANKNKIIDKYKSYDYLYWKIVALGVSLNFLTLSVSIFQRFSGMLFQFAILLLPIILYDLRNNFKRKDSFLFVYLLFCLLLLFYGFRIINEDLIRPYRMF